MSFLTIFEIIALVFLTFFRAFLNASIWNNLHDKNQKMMVNADNIDEVDSSNESVLFGLFCCFIFVWFKFKKEDSRKVVYSTLLSVVSLLLVLLLIFY